VPVRFIAEEFGADVTWNDRERKVTIKEKETTIELWIDRKRALINKKEYTLDVSPKIVNKRTFVPVRFIAEGFGADVTWNDKNQTVVIRRRS